MSIGALHVLVGTALTKEGFAEILLTNPDTVLGDFNLSIEERGLVITASAIDPFWGGGLKGFARVLANSEIAKGEFPFSL